MDFITTLKGFNPKEIKAHASEILKAGGALYDALGQEPELREHRARAVAGHVDTDFVERSVQEAISQVGLKMCCEFDIVLPSFQIFSSKVSLLPH